MSVLEQGPIPEAFRLLALRVGDEVDRRGGSSVVVTSAVPREGKTVTACNLALALASLQSDQRIALLDLDLRNPRVARSLGLSPSAGIESVLSQDLPIEAVRLRTRARLDVFPVRAPAALAHKLLSGPALPSLLKELESHYAYVVCDSPPALPIPDVEILLRHAAWFIAVVRSGKTPRSAFSELCRRLPGEKFLGTFMNDAHARRHDYYEDYYTRPTPAADAIDEPEAD